MNNALTPTSPFFPREFSIPSPPEMFGGTNVSLELREGLTVLVGPNASGKTNTLRGMRDALRSQTGPGRYVVYLAAGRSSALESYRSASTSPAQSSTPGRSRPSFLCQ